MKDFVRDKICEIIDGMKPPIFVRSLNPSERKQLQAGLRSRNAFTVRRCQILLASSRQQKPSSIALSLGCASQTVRNAIRDFHNSGLASLEQKSRRPKSVEPLLNAESCEQIRAILHSSPRLFGKSTSVWSLDLIAEVAFEQGLVSIPVSREVIRRAIARLGVKWKRAKNWITSPDPQYALKKSNLKG